MEKLLAARDLLVSTRRTLQLVDDEVAKLKDSRVAVETARDVSSEHRVAWFGAVDDNDHQNGIQVFSYDENGPSPTGFGNPYRGTVRVQEDAAFVCTRIMVAMRVSYANEGAIRYPNGLFVEAPQDTGDFPFSDVLVRLTDGNTGRNLTPGLTTGPLDRDRGAVPLSALSSIRFGLGSNFKNSLFSEFTIPRAGTVRVEAFNMAPQAFPFLDPFPPQRLFLSLFGYKVYGA